VRQRNTLTLQQRQELRQQAKERRAQGAPESKNYYQLEKYKALRYNYATIDEDKRELVQAAAVEILALRKRAATDIIDIGKRLLETKAMMAHGKFQDWLEIEFDLTLRMAQHFMSAARRFGGAELSDIGTKLVALLESKSEQSSFLGPSVIRLLAAKSVPDSAIEEVLAIAETQDEPVSVEQTKGIIDEHKALQPARPPKPAKPKQLPGPAPEPETIEAEYTVIQTNAGIQLDLTREMVERLRVACVSTRPLKEVMASDMLDSFYIICLKALEGS
jgi:hypothetical protein